MSFSQGLDVIGAAMLHRLVAIAQSLGGTRHVATRDEASSCLKADGSSARASTSGAWAKAVDLRWLSLKDSSDLLLAFMLVGSHDSVCDSALVSALVDAVVDACARCSAHVQGSAAAHVLVEILWSLSVAILSDRTQRMPAGKQRDKRVQLESLQARLLHTLARRWSSGLMTLVCRDPNEAAGRASCGAHQPPQAHPSRCAQDSCVGSEMKDVHTQMLLQVVLTAPRVALQQQSVDLLVKHVRELARQSDCARLARHDAMLDDMHQVPFLV
jgi:hypothetical protein